MNPTNSNPNQNKQKLEKVNRANQITTYREPTSWIEIPEDQIPKNLLRDDNEPKLIEFCQIIKEHGSDNLIILKKQLFNNNGPPDFRLPPTANRCVFWKEIDLTATESENETKQQYTVINAINPTNKDKSIESCEKIQKRYAEELHNCSVDAEVACAMSQEFLEILKHIIKEGPNANSRPPGSQHSKVEVNTQSTSKNTYKYDQDFRKVIEAYPMSCEWFSNKTVTNENSQHHDKSTTKGTTNDVTLKNMNNVLLASDHSLTLNNICHNKKPEKPACPPSPLPPCPPPPCTMPPISPLQSCDPDSVKIQCSSGDIRFKLQCIKVKTDCQNPDGRYECEIIDEGNCVDSKVLESCDLKCQQIEAIHEDEDIEDPLGPIVAQVVEDNKDDKAKPAKKISTMVCTKDGVNFVLKCSKTVPDPDFPSDVRFVCEFEEAEGDQKVTALDILSATLKCKQISNVSDDSVLSDEDDKNVTNENDTKGDECFPNSFEVIMGSNSNETEEKKITYACCSKTKIEKDENECSTNDTDRLTVFIDSIKTVEAGHCEQQTSYEQLKGSYLENHNKTMEILRAATNDLLCTMTDVTREYCKDKISKKCNTNVVDMECLNTAKKSCENIIKTVCQSAKELGKSSKETLDSLANQTRRYICTENECRSEEPPKHKPRKAGLTDAKNITNDIGNKNVFEQLQRRHEFEKIKHSDVKLINETKKPSKEEFDITSAMNTVKKSYDTLYDKVRETSQKISEQTSKAYNEVSTKSMKWFDSNDRNQPSTGQKNLQKMLSGISVLQSDGKPSDSPLEDIPSRNWTHSIHSVFSPLSDTIKDFKTNLAEKSSPYDTPLPPRQMRHGSDAEESNTLSSMFSTLKEKLFGMFYDQNESESITSSSSYSDDSDKE